MWKQNRSLFAYFRFMGLVMLIVGIGLIADGIGDYADQSHQKDWISIEATVTDVSSEEDTSSTLHSSHSTYYIMHMSMPWTGRPIRAAPGVCHRPT